MVVEVESRYVENKSTMTTIEEQIKALMRFVQVGGIFKNTFDTSNLLVFTKSSSFSSMIVGILTPGGQQLAERLTKHIRAVAKLHNWKVVTGRSNSPEWD